MAKTEKETVFKTIQIKASTKRAIDELCSKGDLKQYEFVDALVTFVREHNLTIQKGQAIIRIEGDVKHE